MHPFKSRLQKWQTQFCQTLAIASLAFVAAPAIAQPYEGRFRGNSTDWRPDYVGTLQMQQQGAYSYTATADVELQRVTNAVAPFSKG